MAYSLGICSDGSYERLIAEILFEDGSMLIISQERSLQQFDASLYSPPKSTDNVVEKPSLIDLDELMTAIAEAKERLRLVDVAR
jgi:hypothetical protein